MRGLLGPEEQVLIFLFGAQTSGAERQQGEGLAASGRKALVERHFKPLLNTNGLFDDYKTAKWCLDCMASIQTICPDWFESGENTF